MKNVKPQATTKRTRKGPAMMAVAVHIRKVNVLEEELTNLRAERLALQERAERLALQERVERQAKMLGDYKESNVAWQQRIMQLEALIAEQKRTMTMRRKYLMQIAEHVPAHVLMDLLLSAAAQSHEEEKPSVSAFVESMNSWR